jgi:amino acid adenylation domain-containing protein
MSMLSFEPHAATVDVPTLKRVTNIATSCGTEWDVAFLVLSGVLVHRHVGWERVEVGWIRDDGRAERTTACGACTLVPIDLTGDPTFSDLLARTAAELTLASDGGGNPMQTARSVTYVLQSDRQLHRLPNDSTAAIEHCLSPQETVALVVTSLDDGGLSVEPGKPLRHDASSALRPLVRRLISLAVDVARAPESRISELPLLDALERARTVASWQPNIQRRDDRPVHEVLSLTAARMGRSPAVSAAGRTVSYVELELHANQLAHYLRERGMAVGTHVGICLERSPDAIVAIFATLKAGGVYLFLDPDVPDVRLRQMLAECDVRVAITETRFTAPFRAAHVETIHVDADKAPIEAASIAETPVSVTADHPAYILYTSGTAGRPKAILGTHRSILNGLNDVPFQHDDPDEVCSLDSSLSFGLSLARLFLPLLCGRHLVILPEGREHDLTELVSFWEAAKVTNIVLVTPLCRRLLAFGPRLTSRLSAVRTVAVGGSPVTADVMTLFRTLMPHATMVVGYASSEAGGVIAKRELSENVSIAGDTVGPPYPNTSVYILDDHLEPLPVGVAGEVYIAAPHLSLGYLNQPALTAERYLANPFSDLPGERMFRTGDKGRYTATGEIEILGRIDDTVKVRGFRIDLQELESTLMRHHDVGAAAVTVRTISNESQLVAYLVAANGVAPTASNVREFLSQWLPGYMIPSRFIIVDELALTPVGKVDRGRLPAIGAERPLLDSAYVAPASDTERELVRMLEQLFEMDGIGIDDHFVELGGDSILAAILGSRICDTFDVDFSIANVFEFPTVRELALHLQPADDGL